MPIFSDARFSDFPANPSPEPPPLQVVSCDRADKLGFDSRQMQIVAATSTTAFELPQGWIVEVRPRGPNSSGFAYDKYYYEPGTGRKFRSLISIKRYLNGEEEIVPRKRQSSSSCLVPYQNPGSFRRVVYGGKALTMDEIEEALGENLDDIFPETLQPRTPFSIPDGWIVEEVPRRSELKSDRYYIEPETGRKFRSIPEVHRYLAAEKLKRSNCRALALSNHAKAPRSRAPRKKNTSVTMLKHRILDLANPPEKVKNNTSVTMLKHRILDLANPPEKVNWIYSGDGRDNWSPLLDECMLPDYVKEQWLETFLLGMNGWKQRVPQLTMGGNNQTSNA